MKPMLYTRLVIRSDVSTARANLAKLLEASKTHDVLIEKYGEPAGVLVSAERHAQLIAALEELEDVRAFDVARSEEGENLPWEQVKADLGWT